MDHHTTYCVFYIPQPFKNTSSRNNQYLNKRGRDNLNEASIGWLQREILVCTCIALPTEKFLIIKISTLLTYSSLRSSAEKCTLFFSSSSSAVIPFILLRRSAFRLIKTIMMIMKLQSEYFLIILHLKKYQMYNRGIFALFSLHLFIE